MTGILPDVVNGGKVVRDAANACFAPVGVANIYCPPATFTSTCDITALPSDCTARITPAQVNAIVSEMLALAVAFTPNGTWNCASVTNLATAFTTWKGDFGHADQVTIGGTGTVADPYHVIVSGLAAAMCADAAGIMTLAACLISTDAGNGLVLGSDGKLFGAGSATDDTIDGTGDPTDPFRINPRGLVAALCADDVAADALANCMISTDPGNGLVPGTDGRLIAPKTDYFNAGIMGGTANSWISSTVPKTPGLAALDAASVFTGIVPAANTLTAVNATFDGVVFPVRLADGTTVPPIGTFAAGHQYLFRFDKANGTLAAVFDLTTGGVVGAGGAAAADNRNVIYGTAAPLAAIGNNGDYFFDIVNNQWYGPKSAGAWTTNNLIGSDFYNLGNLSGTTVAYTAASPRPDMPNGGPRNNAIAVWTMNVTNTGTNPTLASSGGTARGIRRGDGSNIIAGDLLAGHRILGYYDLPTNTWRATFDLSTGTAIGAKPATAPVVLASGTGNYGATANMGSATGIDAYSKIVIGVQMDSALPLGGVIVQISKDNGATYQSVGGMEVPYRSSPAIPSPVNYFEITGHNLTEPGVGLLTSLLYSSPNSTVSAAAAVYPSTTNFNAVRLKNDSAVACDMTWAIFGIP